MREATVDDGGSGGVWVPARVVASAVPPDARDAVNALASADGLGALKRGWTAGGAVPWNGDGGGGGGFDVGAVVAGVRRSPRGDRSSFAVAVPGDIPSVRARIPAPARRRRDPIVRLPVRRPRAESLRERG